MILTAGRSVLDLYLICLFLSIFKILLYLFFILLIAHLWRLTAYQVVWCCQSVYDSFQLLGVWCYIQKKKYKFLTKLQHPENTICRLFEKKIMCIAWMANGHYRLYSREKTAASCIRIRYLQDAASLTDTRQGISRNSISSSSSISNNNSSTSIANIAAIIVVNENRMMTPSSELSQAR